MIKVWTGFAALMVTFALTTDVSAQTCDPTDVAPANGIPDVCDAAGATNFISGTAGADTLTGTGGADCIFAGAGDDTIDGRGGDDFICGEDGADNIRCGGGADFCDGGAGDDTITGNGGDDVINGGAGLDDLDGGIGDDTINGGADADTINGRDGADTLNGDGGNDTINGQNGNDIINGGDGADILNGDGDNDIIGGDDGDDMIFGGTGDDTVRGGNDDDTIFGGTGNDTLRGQAGNDTIFGEDGDDFLSGSAGNDTLDGGDDADTIQGGGGLDDIQGGLGNDIIDGGGANDTIRGGGGQDDIQGGAGNDTIFGDDAADIIQGGAGDDIIDGGAGGDAILGGDGADTIDGGSGNDRLNGNSTTSNDSDGSVDSVTGGAGTDTCVEGVGPVDTLIACETATPVVVQNVALVRDGGRSILEFETFAEVGTLSFRILDVSGNEVARTVANHESPLGGSYALALPGSLTGQFVIEERLADGTTRAHGPYLRNAVFRSSALPAGARTAVEPRPLTPFVIPNFIRRPIADRTAVAAAIEVTGSVESPRLVAVTLSELALALGRDVTDLRASAESGNMSVRNSGADLPWRLVGDAIQFVARGTRSPFATARTYMVREVAGMRMATGSLTARGASAHEFVARAHFEQNNFAGTVVATDPRSDFFHWQSVIASDARRNVFATDVALPEAVGAVSTLRLSIQGAGDGAHHMVVRWNGSSVAEVDFSGRLAPVIEIRLPAVADLNALEVEAVEVDGSPDSAFYVNWLEVDYTRRASTELGALAVRTVGGVASVQGLTEAAVGAYDISDPSLPVYLGELTPELTADGYGVGVTTAASNVLFAQSAETLTARPVYDPGFDDASRRADYVIITTPELLDGANAIAAHRGSQGREVMVLELQDIRDRFASGDNDPLAVAAMLRHVREVWARSPREVLLLGVGSFDYRDAMGLGGNLVPPPLAATRGGLFPADTLMGDLDGFDGVPEVVIGRLPMTSISQVDSWLATIQAFEETPRFDAFLVSDVDEETATFSRVHNELGAMIGSPSHLQIDPTDIEGARSAFFSGWGTTGFLSYVGHGGMDRLSDHALVTFDDLEALRGAKTVLTAWTCNIARFDVPGFAPLASRIVTESGAPAVIAGTGWSNHHDTPALREGFYENLTSERVGTLGDAWRYAQQNAGGDAPETRVVYALVGDPGTKLRDVIVDPSTYVPGTLRTPDINTRGTRVDPPIVDPPVTGFSGGGCAAGGTGAGLPFMLMLVFGFRRRWMR